jgi:hypothetical protein
VIVIVLRLTIPLLILRWPLAGGIAAMLADALDVVAIEAIGMGGFGGHYSELDKALDYYYLTLELVVATRWASSWARVPAILLYIWRGIGVVAFETTHWRPMLLIFPNQFENWWFYCVVTAACFPKIHPHSWRSTWIPMLALLIPKMAQEYMLHYLEAEPWDWTKDHVLR